MKEIITKWELHVVKKRNKRYTEKHITNEKSKQISKRKDGRFKYQKKEKY